MKKMPLLFLLLLALSSSGCSKNYWPAQLYVFKAENAFMKGRLLKSQKATYEEQLPHYRQSCSYFLKAYELNPSIFTLTRIQQAGDACWRAEDIPNRDKFRDYEEEYAKKHPVENEYGDAGVLGVGDSI